MKFPLKQFNAFVQDSGLADSQYVEYTRYLREMWHAQSGTKERLPESTCELGCGRLKEFRQLLQNACLTPNGVKFLEEERERFMNRRQQHNSRQRKKERLRDDGGSGGEFSPMPRHDARMGGSFPSGQFPSGPSGYPPYLPQLPQGGGPDMLRMGGGSAGGSVGGGGGGSGGPGPAGQGSGSGAGMQRMPFYQYQWPPAGSGHGMMGQQGAMVMPQQSMMPQHVHGGQGGPGMMVMGGQQMVPQHGMPPPAGGAPSSHAPAQYVMSLQHQLMQPSPSKNSSEMDAARNLSMISSNWMGSGGRMPVESPRRGHPHGEFEGPQLPPQQHHVQPYQQFQQMQYHHQGQQLPGPGSMGPAGHPHAQRGPPHQHQHHQQHQHQHQHQAPLEGPLPLGDHNSDDEADDDGDDDEDH